ncbi:MAG: Calx-beta domain-containing protein, partial [Candidatus Limnocylindria bacterium]
MVVEGDSGTVNALFTVTLSRPSTGTVTYAFATANDTATVVADYQAATGTVTFAPGDVSETITVAVVGDTVDEPNETFFVNLATPVGGTILDDEGPIVTPTPAAAQLPNTGTSDGPAGWGPPAMAIAFLAAATAAWLRARRSTARAG